MDEYWAARERAEDALAATKDALENFMQLTERAPELTAVPAVVDRLVVLTTMIMADLNERGVGVDFDDLESIQREVGQRVE